MQNYQTQEWIPQSQQTYIQMIVNLVFILDHTGSMRNFIKLSKQRIKNMIGQIESKCDEKGRCIKEFNTAVISFGDVLYDQKWVDVSPFFRISDGQEQLDAFHQWVEGIHVHGGGGDGPESGLEALSAALHELQIKPTPLGCKTRTVYVVLTDAAAHPLKDANQRDASYPEYAEHDLDELYLSWLDIQGPVSSRSKRLVLFAPDVYPWNEIRDSWQQVSFYKSIAGAGLQDMDLDRVTSFIADSI